MSKKVTTSFISNQVREAKHYFLDLNPKTQDGIRVVCGGVEHCTPNYLIDRTDFAYFSIEYVSVGQGQLTLRNKAFPLRPGSIFCYGPNIPHRIECDPKHPMTKYFVDFVGNRAETLLKETSFFKYEPLYINNPLRVYDLFENLQQYGLSHIRNAPHLCSLLVEMLILVVTDQAFSYKEADSTAWGTYERCRTFIENHYLRIHSVSEMARHCQVNTAYLCRLFKRFDQETPYGLLTRLKMSRAAELLRHSDLLVKQVAQQVGFDDPYHFSRAFKRVYNLSPDAFVKKDHRQQR